MPNTLVEQRAGVRESYWPGILASLAIFLLLLIVAKDSPIGGDAALYARHVRETLDKPWDDPLLWQFSHLLWRPYGRMMSILFLPMAAPYFGGSTDLTISFFLILPNLIAGAICAILLQKMVQRLTGSLTASLVTVTAFLGLNTILHYTRIGSPYICCLASLLGAIYWMAFRKDTSSKAAFGAGALGAIGPLLWIPFLFSLPAILVSGYVLDLQQKKARLTWRRALYFCAGAAVVGFGVYAFGMAVAHITTPAQFLAWVHESATDTRSQKALRMISGVVRGFYDTGDESVWLKWYLFRDPYAQVNIWEVVQASLFRLGLLYLGMALLFVFLWRTSQGKHLLVWIAVSCIPHLALAVSYESASAERYIALIPSLLLSVGYILGSSAYGMPLKIALGVLWCIPLPANVISADARNVTKLLRRDPLRLEAMKTLPPHSRMVALNSSDPLFQLDYVDPTNSLHLIPLPTVNIVAGTMGSGISEWRRNLACLATDVWELKGEVWVSKRVLAPRPERSWLWVEGDLAGLRWEQIRDFFKGFDHSQEKGPADGFFLLADTSASRERLLAEFPGNQLACVNGASSVGK